MKKQKKFKKIIGVLGRPALDDENDKLIAFYDDCRTAIIKKNCIPFMICPVSNVDYLDTKNCEIPDLSITEKVDLKAMVDLCDGVIIPGGYRWYNYDIFVVKYALEKDIPILGICMGMQLLATLDNGEACLELNETFIDHRQRGKKYVHKVNIIEGTLLSKIINEKEINVNSKHRYHVTKTNNLVISFIF